MNQSVAERIFSEKLPRVENLVHFLMMKKGIPEYQYGDMLQASLAILWKKCLKATHPKEISSTLVVRSGIAEVAKKFRQQQRYKLFTDVDSGIDRCKQSNDDSDYADTIESNGEEQVLVDGTVMTVTELAMDCLDVYAQKGLSRQEVAEKLGLNEPDVKLLRKRLGVPSVDPRYCHNSLSQLSKQLSDPINWRQLTVRRKNNSTVLKCSDCGKEQSFYPSQLKDLSKVYRCRKCVVKYVHKNAVQCPGCRSYMKMDGTNCIKCGHSPG